MAEASIVVTVKDEEIAIIQLLRSIQNQSLKPHEVIIVDGGSKDKTVEEIKALVGSDPSFRIVLAEGANRSRGRNIGITAAATEIIACTDAGVVLDRFWLENIVKPLTNGEADFVSGVYVQSGESPLQKCIGALQYPNLAKLDASFLASSRSVAFRKTVWQSVGGYPEDLEKAEDTFFDMAVRQRGFRIFLAKDAVVYFPARNSLRALFSQYSSYAEWDVRACLVSKLSIYRFMLLAYILLAFLLFLTFLFHFWGFLFSILTILAYLVNSGVKAYRKTGVFSSFFFGIAVKVTIFVAETWGLAKGFVRRFSRRK